MIKALLSLPKAVLVLILLGGGVLFIVLFDPPHTVCDTQLDNFKENQKIFLFEGSNKVKGKKAPPDVVQLSNMCESEKTPGACYEFFHKLKDMIRDLGFVTEECRERVGDLKQVKQAVWDNIKLMAKISWGANPPESPAFKLGWYTHADLNLYCNLRRTARTFYPISDWESFREKTLKDMPGAGSLSRSQSWGLSLLSTRCNQYL